MKILKWFVGGSVFLLSPLFARATFTQIVFTTVPQAINQSATSSTITIQTQDGDGNSSSTPETLDVIFNSTSPTGVFLGPGGGLVTTTMSKNTANKNFLYIDSTAGTFTLSISVTGRESGQSWGASQSITINSTIPAPVLGCMDQNATNYNPNATHDDGGCEYQQDDEGSDSQDQGQSLNSSTDDSSPTPVSQPGGHRRTSSGVSNGGQVLGAFTSIYGDSYYSELYRLFDELARLLRLQLAAVQALSD